MPIETYVSVKDFAEMQGVSRQYVQGLVERGVLPRTKLGIPVRKAQAAWDARPGRHGKTKKSADAEDTESKTKKIFEKATISKAKSEIFKSKLVELELKTKKSLLIPIEEVRADALAIGEALRGELLAIAPRISALCEGRDARDIEEIIDTAINEALLTLQKSSLAGGKNGAFFAGATEGAKTAGENDGITVG